MATTFIKTGNCLRKAVPGAGETAEVLNEALCGAKNVLAKLHWLNGGDKLQTTGEAATHHLIYVMDGEGVITLNGKDYPMKKGAGVYFGQNETTVVRPAGQGPIKLFHLAVPQVADQ